MNNTVTEHFFALTKKEANLGVKKNPHKTIAMWGRKNPILSVVKGFCFTTENITDFVFVFELMTSQSRYSAVLRLIVSSPAKDRPWVCSRPLQE